MQKNRTPERLPSPVRDLGSCRAVIGPLRQPWKISSERTQQNRAYKSKHGHHRQHVQSQGKFHVSAPCSLT
jgi:hypothetical protein